MENIWNKNFQKTLKEMKKKQDKQNWQRDAEWYLKQHKNSNKSNTGNKK